MTEKTLTQSIRLNFLRLTRSDFLQNIVATVGSRGIVILLGFLTSVIIIRALGPEGRGQFAVGCTMTGMGVQLGLLGFHSANTFHVSKNPSLLSVMISNSLLISCGMGGVAMTLLFFCRHFMLGSSSLPPLLLFLSLLNIPINICFLLFQGLLTGVQRFNDYNQSEILNKSFFTLLIVLFFSLGKISATTTTFFLALAMVICLCMMLKTLFKLTIRLKAPSFNLIKNNFFYGGKAYLSCFFAWGITRIDVFFLQRSQGFEQVGYLSVALSIIDILLLLSSAVATVLYPKLCAEPDIKKKWALTKKTALGSSIIILLIALIITLWSAPVRWVYGAQFTQSHSILVSLLPGFIFLSVESILAQFIISVRFPWSLVFIWGVALVLKFAVSLWIIPQMGIKGVGVTWAIIYLAIFISVLINIKSMIKQTKHKPEVKAL